ncbi:MAG: hypothetical protein U0263_41160 [Polyangiaceae bacterium]
MKRLMKASLVAALVLLGGCAVGSVESDENTSVESAELEGQAGVPDPGVETHSDSLGKPRDLVVSTGSDPSGPTPYPWLDSDDPSGGPTPYPWGGEPDEEGATSSSGSSNSNSGASDQGSASQKNTQSH